MWKPKERYVRKTGDRVLCLDPGKTHWATTSKDGGISCVKCQTHWPRAIVLKIQRVGEEKMKSSGWYKRMCDGASPFEAWS